MAQLHRWGKRGWISRKRRARWGGTRSHRRHTPAGPVICRPVFPVSRCPRRGDRPPAVEKAVIPPARLAGATACPAERVARRRAGCRERWPLRPAGWGRSPLFFRGKGSGAAKPACPAAARRERTARSPAHRGTLRPPFLKRQRWYRQIEWLLSGGSVPGTRKTGPSHRPNIRPHSLPPHRRGQPLFSHQGRIHRMVGYWGKDRFPLGTSKGILSSLSRGRGDGIANLGRLFSEGGAPHSSRCPEDPPPSP